MPEQMWHCSDCGQPYFSEGQALQCEKDHVHIGKCSGGVEKFIETEKFPEELTYNVLVTSIEEGEPLVLMYEVKYRKSIVTSRPA
jgi:hypothetical protein